MPYSSSTPSQDPSSPRSSSHNSHYFFRDGPNQQLYHVELSWFHNVAANYQHSEEGDDSSQNSISHFTYARSSDDHESEEESSNSHHIYVSVTDNRQQDSLVQSPQIPNEPFQTGQGSSGLAPGDIQNIPIIKWSQQYRNRNHEQLCSICHIGYELMEDLRVFCCLHRFHKQCIDTWLVHKNTCPQCRLRIEAPCL